MSFEQLLQRQLEEALPLQGEEGRDWDDVLQRAGVPRRRPRQLLVLAALIVLLGVPSAYAVGPRLAAYFGGSAAPAPATVETSDGRVTMGVSSACWSEDDGRALTTACSSMPEPRCGDGSTPNVEARRGDPVRFALAFDPTELELVFPAADLERVVIPPARTVTWRPDRSGVVVLAARSADGSAAYTVCLRLR